jgi:hypothetical protein
MHYDQDNRSCLIHDMFIAFWFEISAMKTLFLWMYSWQCLIMLVDFNYRMWGIGMVMPLWLWRICKTMYVALDALMETLGILWKVNWLGMVAMLCLLACHEAKVNAWTSMLLIFKLMLPTCQIFQGSFHNIVKRKF